MQIVTIQKKKYRAEEKINFYLQMRMEKAIEDLYRRKFPKQKFDHKKFRAWIEVNQSTPEFIGVALDLVLVPVGHTTNISEVLETAALSPKETNAIVEALNFFAESVSGSKKKRGGSR